MIGINVVIQVALALLIVVFVNLSIHYWHPPRIDLSRSEYYKLSTKTKELLKSLKRPVEIIVFIQPDSQDPIVPQVFNDVQTLLKEYEAETKLLKVRYVDPDRDPIQAKRLAEEYGVRDPNVVVFVCEKRNKYVAVKELVDLDRPQDPFSGGGGRIKAFKGEQQFTSAIQNVLDVRQPKIYFLEGHGEGDPFDVDRKDGYSVLGTYIRRDNLMVEKMNLLEKQQVPKDCDLLIICGPTKPFNEVEIKAVQDYLATNGRLMALFNGMRAVDTGLEKVMADYGVKIGNDLVICEFLHPFEGRTFDPIAGGVKYPAHPITEALRKERVNTRLPMCCSVDRLSAADAAKFRVTILVETPAENSWAETDLEKLQKKREAEMDSKDRKGPVPIAAAVEPASAGEMEREGMRMVIFGSSTFVQNGQLTGGNMDLFMNALNWLIKRQQLLGIAAKMPQEFSLTLGAAELRGVFIMEVFGIPLAVAAIGFLVWLARRK